jgi:hypothetical protein
MPPERHRKLRPPADLAEVFSSLKGKLPVLDITLTVE